MELDTANSRQRARTPAAIGILACVALLAGLFAPPARAQAVPDYAAIVAAPERSDADRETDKRRDPVKLLAFTGVRPGMKVLDMGAGGGYSTELMARAAGPSGTVYGQNAPDLGGRAKERIEARMQTPAMKNVVMLARPFDDPLPAEVRDLDLITFFFYYHDTDLHGGRSRRNEPQALRRAQAGRHPGDRRPLREAGRGYLGGKDDSIASRRACSAARSRRPASSWSARATSCVTPRTRATSR